MNLSTADYLAIQARMDESKRKKIAPTETAKSLLDSCTKESDLHDQIRKHCNAQFPKWKYIHCRMDKRSTVDKGASDFTIFMPEGKVLSVEVKTKTGKLSTEQHAWALEMKLLNHVVHVVRSMEEFLNICRTQGQK